MARPKRYTVDYFPMICDQGKKMYYIEERYGNDGYATWMKLLRELAVTENHYLHLGDDVSIMYLASKCKVTEEKLVEIIDDLVKLKQFDKLLWNENRVLWNQTFVDGIQDAYKKRSNDCIDYEGLLILLSSLGVRKPSNGIQEQPENPQSKVKESKEDKSKLNETKLNQNNSEDFDDSEFQELEIDELEDLLKTEKITVYTAAGFIIKYLAEFSGQQYSLSPENRKRIEILIQQGFEIEMIKKVIQMKSKQASEGSWQYLWLKPKTLFDLEKFEGYANEVRNIEAGRATLSATKPSEVDRRRQEVEALKKMGIG